MSSPKPMNPAGRAFMLAVAVVSYALALVIYFAGFSHMIGVSAATGTAFLALFLFASDRVLRHLAVAYTWAMAMKSRCGVFAKPKAWQPACHETPPIANVIAQRFALRLKGGTS